MFPLNVQADKFLKNDHTIGNVINDIFIGEHTIKL